METPGRRRTLRWAFLGRMGFSEGVALQNRLRERVGRGAAPDHLLLLEHPHVYTLGRSASSDDVVINQAERDRLGIELAETDRGGQVTYHGPGQLVGYPIVNLDPDRRDVGRYVRDLQAVLVRALARLGIVARGGEGAEDIGVWVEDRKIASIGVHLRRWVATHGFALNVATDLSYFGGIVACGLPGVAMTSIEWETGSAPGLEEIGALCAQEFAAVFECSLEEAADLQAG